MAGGLDQQVVRAGRGVRLAAVAHHVHDQRDVPAADDVVGAQRPLAGAQAGAVEEGAVGAAQVAHAPAVGRVPDLRVPAADRAVVQDDLECGQAARPEEGFALPRHPFDVAVDAAQANVPLHQLSPLGALFLSAPSAESRLDFARH